MTGESTTLPGSTPAPAPRVRHPLTLPHFRNLCVHRGGSRSDRGLGVACLSGKAAREID
jgi:hypothetical protein